MFNNARHRARERGLSFQLTLDDIAVPESCPVLGIPLISGLAQGNKRAKKDNSPTLDRIDNCGGYDPDNIVVVSFRANRIKSDATVDELKLIAQFYDGLRDRKKAA